MRYILILFIATFLLQPLAASAGDLPANDVRFVRLLLLQPDVDFTLYRDNELCDSLLWLIENDTTEQRDRIVRRALCALPETEDPRAVDLLTEYIPLHPLDCLNGLGDFSTIESTQTLLQYIDDEDEFIRMFSAEALGRLDFTISDEMWELRDPVINALAERVLLETEDWILPVIETSFISSAEQVFVSE